MSLVKRLCKGLLSAYLRPLTLNSRLALYAKGRMIPDNEHYLVTLDTIRNKFASNKGIIIDVGAFDGDSTLYLAKQLKQNIVYGFEPNPIPFQKALSSASSFSNIRLYNFGFADRTGEMDLHVTTNYVSSSLFAVKDSTETSPKEIIRIGVNTLDNFFHTHPDILLLKLDAQGAELSTYLSMELRH